MGRLSAGILRCAGHHGKAQCRDPGVHRASWEGKVQGSRGAQGIMGRLSAGIQGCTGHHGKLSRGIQGTHGLMGTLRRISKLGGGLLGLVL